MVSQASMQDEEGTVGQTDRQKDRERDSEKEIEND